MLIIISSHITRKQYPGGPFHVFVQVYSTNIQSKSPFSGLIREIRDYKNYKFGHFSLGVDHSKISFREQNIYVECYK